MIKEIKPTVFVVDDAEDFVHMLQRMGRRPDIKLDVLLELARDAARFFGRDMAGRLWKTGPVPTIVRQGT